MECRNEYRNGSIRLSGRAKPGAHSTALPRIPTQVALLVLMLAAPSAQATNCIPIHEAAQHIGETKCVVGKVIRIRIGANGVHFLEFCEDAMACSFTVVVFGRSLKEVGDVRRLGGRTIEIEGAPKVYDCQPEIILRRTSRIEGGAATIPPFPGGTMTSKTAASIAPGETVLFEETEENQS